MASKRRSTFDEQMHCARFIHYENFGGCIGDDDDDDDDGIDNNNSDNDGDGDEYDSGKAKPYCTKINCSNNTPHSQQSAATAGANIITNSFQWYESEFER